VDNVGVVSCKDYKDILAIAHHLHRGIPAIPCFGRERIKRRAFDDGVAAVFAKEIGIPDAMGRADGPRDTDEFSVLTGKRQRCDHTSPFGGFKQFILDPLRRVRMRPDIPPSDATRRTPCIAQAQFRRAHRGLARPRIALGDIQTRVGRRQPGTCQQEESVHTEKQLHRMSRLFDQFSCTCGGWRQWS